MSFLKQLLEDVLHENKGKNQEKRVSFPLQSVIKYKRVFYNKTF